MFPSRASVILVFLASLCLMSSTVASPLRPSTKIPFSHLYGTAENVVDLTRKLYKEYRNDRFDEITIVRPQDLIPPLADIPNIQNVQNYLSDQELVCLHYSNLLTFKEVLERVYETEETGGFNASIDKIVEELAFIIQRLETVQNEYYQSPCSTQPPPSDINFNSKTKEQNLRTLYVLQEFKHYISRVEYDYEILYRRHQNDG